MTDATPPNDVSAHRITATDLHLFNEGSHFRLYEKLGAHVVTQNGVKGVAFSVWAPNAAKVSVVGGFNEWDKKANPMKRVGKSGIWQAFVPGVKVGALYKYHLVSKHNGYTVDKADPFAFYTEVAPQTGSKVWIHDYAWNDGAWLAERGARQKLDQPISVYEVHLGSWLRNGREHLTYRELAPKLAAWVKELGFTHVQLMPITEHPFYGSWGYGVTGYFAPTSRYGTPQDFMAFVDVMHQAGIGVILDWVASHFPKDGWALGFFDGTHLYEHADPKKGHHPDWNSNIFNYGRFEVVSFLISSALFWIDRFHLDGLRVDAVASMLYLDYSRKEGEWVPNQFGGKENLEAIAFLRKLNEVVYAAYPDVQVIAEESTSWPMVSKPVYLGGLGFGMKWDMGWMHDTLEYMQADPIYRKFIHNKMTFRQVYSDSENFMLPLSHDEVVHGKRSLLSKMPGDEWRMRANLRLCFAWMFAQNGKKLLFMGAELGQWREWNHETDLDWSLLEKPEHRGLKDCLAALNRLYREQPAMHVKDTSKLGFEWIDCRDADQSVFLVLRHGEESDPPVAALFNFTPIPRPGYRVGVPRPGTWRVVVNTDDTLYGGSGASKLARVDTQAQESQGKPHSFSMDLPPLGAIFLVHERAPDPAPEPVKPEPEIAATAPAKKSPKSKRKSDGARTPPPHGA
jgi:1,4-alpha-glucan branching enzyme